MAKIEGFRIKNYRALKDVALGKLWNLQKSEPLTPMTAVIGKNGVGKSTLFDAFGFLADCLKTVLKKPAMHGDGEVFRKSAPGANPAQLNLRFIIRRRVMPGPLPMNSLLTLIQQIDRTCKKSD